MKSTLYLVFTQQQLFQAVLIHLKNKPILFLFVVEESLLNSIYLSNIQSDNLFFFKESDYPYINFVGRLRRVAKYHLLPEPFINLNVDKIFNAGRYCFLSELICNKFHDAHYYELDDGLSTNFLSDHWLKLNRLQTFVYLLKKILKYPFVAFVWKFRNYELFDYNFNYIRKRGKTAVRWFPEIETRTSINTVPLISLINQKDIVFLYRSSVVQSYQNRVYFFLSYDTKESEIKMSKEYIYVGHPRRTYVSSRIIKNVPSDLIAINNSIVTQPSSLIIVFLFAKKYLNSENILTVDNGNLLIKNLSERSQLVRDLIDRGEIINT
jgi:hypothetical protein